MGLRYEAWTTPWDPGGFKRKVAMMPVLDGTGTGSVPFLGVSGDSSVDISLAQFDRLSDLVSDTEASLVTVYDAQPDGTNTVIDEWVLDRLPLKFVDQKTASLSGPSLLKRALESALVYAFDYPTQPAVQADWVWGAADDSDSSGLIQNGNFETVPMPNGGFEEGNTGLWERTEADGGLYATSAIQAVFSSADARTGDWYGRVVVTSQGDGIRRTISGLVPGNTYTITGWINEPTGAGHRLRAGVIGASSASHTNAYEEDETFWAEIGNVAQGAGSSTGVYQQVTLTFVVETDHIELVVIYDEPGGTQDFHVDDFSITGTKVGLDPWTATVSGGLQPGVKTVNTFTHSTAQAHSGAGSVLFQGVDDAFYDAFGRIGYGTIGITQRIRMTPGQLYTFTAWVRHDGSGANGANELIRLVLLRGTPKGDLAATITGEFAPAPGSYYMASRTVSVPQNTWTKIQLTTTADVSDIHAQIRYAGTNTRNTDVGSFNSPNIWIDDVSIHQGLPATTIGDIWQKLLDDCTLHHASQARGTVLNWIDYSSFSATLDSNGNPWNADITFLATWGSNMLHVLDDTFNRGYEAELVRKAVPSGGKTHDFHLYNPGGRDDNPSTALHTLQPITGGDTVKRNPSATRTLVSSPDGSYTESEDATLVANFGRLEKLIQDSEATGPTSRQLLADNFFAFEQANQNAVRFELVETASGPRPFVSFKGGDTIPMTMVPGLAKEDRRVQRIDYVNTHPTQYVVVGSRLLRGEAAAFDLVGRMWRRMNRPAKMAAKEPAAPTATGGVGGAPTIYVAASNATQQSKDIAHFVCSGSNDHEIVQAAVDICQQSTSGGVVQLSEGTFSFTFTTSMSAAVQIFGGAIPSQHISIRGMGPEITIVTVAGNATGGTSVFDLAGNGNNELRDLSIKDTVSATHTHIGVIVSNYGRVQNVHGFITETTPTSYFIQLAGVECVVDGVNCSAAGIGIQTSNGFHKITNCNFWGIDNTGILISNVGDYTTISDCVIATNDGYGIQVYSSRFVKVNNLVIEALWGVYGDNCPDAQVSNVTVYPTSNGGDSFLVLGDNFSLANCASDDPIGTNTPDSFLSDNTGWDGVTVTGCHTDSPMYLDITDDIVITGCVLGGGIDVSGSERVVISDCVLRDPATGPPVMVPQSVTTVVGGVFIYVQNGQHITIADCVFGSTDGLGGFTAGIAIYGSASYLTISNVYVQGMRRGFEVSANTLRILDSHVDDAKEHGIVINSSFDAEVRGTHVYDAGLDTNNTWDGIFVNADSDRIKLWMNHIRCPAAGNKMRYGINISAASTDGAIVIHNDFRPSANFGTDALNDAGTGTILEDPSDVTYGDNFT